MNARRLINKQIGEPDKDAVKEVYTFFMNMKKTTRAFQCRVDWKNPPARIKTVLNRISRTTPAYVASASSRKQSKQQRRSSAGIGRDLPDALPGLAVEWNVDAERSWVWNDNQRGASNDDPELLTRLLRQNLFLPDKSDVLAEGKKVIPVDVLASAYRKFLERDNPPLPPFQSPSKVAKIRERASMVRHSTIKDPSGRLLHRK